MKLWTMALAVATACLPRIANAHFDLMAPPSSSMTREGGKGAPPCGPDMPSANPLRVQGGHPLPIKIVETVFHPGHYRFALSMNSRSELPPDPPVVAPNNQSESATIQNPPVFPVLADGVFAHTTGNNPITFEMQLMLPNITCAKCTLQVIEFMAKHGPNQGGGYFYHHCADLAITADPNINPADAGVGPAKDASTGSGPDSSTGAPDAAAGGTGGTPGTGGAGTATGGSAGTGTGGAGTGTGGTTTPTAGKSGGGGGGGGCAFGGPSPGSAVPLALAVLGAILVSRRRRS